LNAAEGPVSLRTIEPQEFVHTVEQISSNHGDFVNDNCIQILVDVLSIVTGADFSDPFKCDVGLEPKERVDGLPFNIKSGDTCGS